MGLASDPHSSHSALPRHGARGISSTQTQLWCGGQDAEGQGSCCWSGCLFQQRGGEELEPLPSFPLLPSRNDGLWVQGCPQNFLLRMHPGNPPGGSDMGFIHPAGPGLCPQ